MIRRPPVTSAAVERLAAAGFAVGVLRLPLAPAALLHFVPSLVLALPFAGQAACLALAWGGWQQCGGRLRRCGGWRFGPTASLAGGLLDLAVTCAVAAVVLPVVADLTSEPDHTMNVYLGWVYWVFFLYVFFGLCSSALLLAAAVAWCRATRGKPRSPGMCLGADHSTDGLLVHSSNSDASQLYEDELLRQPTQSVTHLSEDTASRRSSLASPAAEGDFVIHDTMYGSTITGKGWADSSAAEAAAAAAAKRARRARATVTSAVLPSGSCLVRLFNVFSCLWFAVALLAIVLGGLELQRALQKDPPASALPTDKSHGGSHAADACDPLVELHCALPFPSDFYLVQDPENPSGRRLKADGLMPSTRWSGTTTLLQVDDADDGFSTVAPVLFALGSRVDRRDLVSASNISQSLRLHETTTLLLDAETGRAVPHFVDREAFDADFGLDQRPQDQNMMLILQAAQALAHNRTFVVAVRNLRSANGDARGGLAAASSAFVALRDKRPDASADRARAFDAVVWPVLAKAGVRRDQTLQLAFSFTTTSREKSVGAFERVREESLETVGPDGPADFEITDIELLQGQDCEDIAMTVHGHMMSPNYLVYPGPAPNNGWFTKPNTEATTASASSSRSATPQQNGVSRVAFLVRVPCSVYNESREASLVLQYGHGLFGSRAEAQDAYLGGMANRFGFLIVATDWKGMSKYDVPTALRIFATRIGEFRSLSERTQQGFLDNQVFLRLVRGRLAKHPKLRTVHGHPLLRKTTQVGYYGNSQGSVIGGGYFASSVDLERAVLGVPGCPFSLLLSRSKDFGPYHDALKLQLWDSVDLRVVISMMQLLWDPAETGGWLHNIASTRLPKPYPQTKHVLLQAALGDAQVTTIAAEFMARSAGGNMSTIYPQTRPVFGLAESVAPFSHNAFVEYRYLDVPAVNRDTDVPPTDGKDTHECPRRERRAQRQLKRFLVDREVVQPCAGMCESKTCPTGDSKNR